jgi:hypothetical protein
VTFVEHVALAVFTFLGVLVTIRETAWFVADVRRGFKHAKEKQEGE